MFCVFLVFARVYQVSDLKRSQPCVILFSHTCLTSVFAHKKETRYARSPITNPKIINHDACTVKTPEIDHLVSGTWCKHLIAYTQYLLKIYHS